MCRKNIIKEENDEISLRKIKEDLGNREIIVNGQSINDFKDGSFFFK